MNDYSAPLISCRKALATGEALAALGDFLAAVEQVEHAHTDLLAVKASLWALACKQKLRD